MNKIGEMTIEEFKEALKIILKHKEEKEEDKRNFIVKFIDDIKKGISEFLSSLLKIKSFFTEPLTQEVFIRRGIKVKAFIKEAIETIVFVLVAIIFIRYCLCEIRWIPSASMHPTLIEGDRVIVDRYSRFHTTPQRGDIMIFYPPDEKLENTPMKVFKRLTGLFCDDVAYIKRVIGLPGDKLEIKRDEYGATYVYINDEPLDEPYIQNPLDYPVCDEYMMCGPIEIPGHYYFMMGDNRGNSRDSRYWGLLKDDRFIGKAVFVTRFHKF